MKQNIIFDFFQNFSFKTLKYCYQFIAEQMNIRLIYWNLEKLIWSNSYFTKFILDNHSQSVKLYFPIQFQISFWFLFASSITDRDLNLSFIICITAPMYSSGLSFGSTNLFHPPAYFYIRQALFFLFRADSIAHCDFSFFVFWLIAFIFNLFRFEYLSLWS